MFSCCSGSQPPELVYFDLPGRGEAIRLAFSVAGIKFIDTRIAMEDWSVVKAAAPEGTLPMLKIDGKKIGQNIAILSYVGLKGKLIPVEPLGYCKVLETLSAIEGVYLLAAATVTAPDAASRSALFEEIKTKVPAFADYLEANLKSSGTKISGYVWKQLSVADLQVYVMVSMVKAGAVPNISPDSLDSKECIMKVYESVAKHPKVMAYYEEQNAKPPSSDVMR